ncbi:hypothetical protein [Vibrio kanaloae]|uniref:hypothetical protein n=1 Tax=Vibrio kanaloae TaxID=170673 RepID=UPI003CE528FE
MMIRFQSLSASRWRFNMLASLVTVGLAGCASNESIHLVGEYAKQSTQVQGALIGVYESADDAKINAELVKAARDGMTGKGLDISTIDRSGQEALLRNLQTFTQSIYFLATDDRGEELDKYSQKLNSSLVSLSEMPQLEGFDDRDVELLTTSVNAIARAYTEKKRYDLLKKVVIDSEKIVQNSLRSLEGELGAWKAATRVSLEKELRIRLYLLNNPNRCVGSEDKRCVTFEHSLEERVDAYEKAYEIRTRLNGLDARYAKLEGALRAIQHLNQSIVVSLKSDDDVTIEAAKKAIKSTRSQIDAIKEYRDSLEE